VAASHQASFQNPIFLLSIHIPYTRDPLSMNPDYVNPTASHPSHKRC